MQEEVTRKTVALCVETSKMTAHVLQKAMKKVLEDMAKAKNQPRLHHGKQTLRQLMKHNTGVYRRRASPHLRLSSTPFSATLYS